MEPIEDKALLQRSNEIQTIGNKAVKNVQEANKEEGVPNVFSVDGKIFYEVNGKITTSNPFDHLKVTPEEKIVIGEDRFKLLYSDKEITDSISRDALSVVSQIQKSDLDKVMFVVMMNGGAWYASRLFNRLQANAYNIAYATTKLNRNGDIKVSTKTKKKDFDGKQIIIIEGFSNSGKSVNKLKAWLLAMGAKSVDVCLMLKRESAEIDTINTPIIVAENDYIMGCGLGYKECGRNLNLLYKKL